MFKASATATAKILEGRTDINLRQQVVPFQDKKGIFST